MSRNRARELTDELFIQKEAVHRLIRKGQVAKLISSGREASGLVDDPLNRSRVCAGNFRCSPSDSLIDRKAGSVGGDLK